jgi:hypothetical protein
LRTTGGVTVGSLLHRCSRCTRLTGFSLRDTAILPSYLLLGFRVFPFVLLLSLLRWLALPLWA